MRVSALAILMFGFLCAPASAAVITFDTLASPVLTHWPAHSVQFVPDGPIFSITSDTTLTPDTAFASWGSVQCLGCAGLSDYTGSAALFNNRAGSQTTLTSFPNAPFTLNSIDLSEQFNFA